MSTFITIPNQSNEGCIPPLNFKPGSIGPKVSFVKRPNSNDTDIIIPGVLEITRGSNGGIYNVAVESNYDPSQSPKFTRWNTQYVDSDNTNWSALTDIQNRTYLIWRTAIITPAGNSATPTYVGMRSIMKYDDGAGTVKYYLIIFTEWQAGGAGGGFAYDRYEILDGIYVEQISSDDPNAQKTIDVVSPNVHLARRYQGGGLYNSLVENSFVEGLSPYNTRWNSIFTDTRPGHSGFANLTNLESRVYTDFAGALDSNIGNNIPGTDLIMHDLTTDVYHKIEFDSWAQGCGGVGTLQFTPQYTNPAGYPEGSTYIQGVGGSGSGLAMVINTIGGNIVGYGITQNGTGYSVGDLITFPMSGVAIPLQITLTSICVQGGFAYTRTPIPQSCGIKFADGTVINSANSLGGVQSVTGLNTNNADPVNPVVRISVDGTTITGNGTPSSPLVATSTSCKPEFIKIASHSCNVITGLIENEQLTVLFGGMPYDYNNSYLPIWSTELYGYKFPFATPMIGNFEKALGIACPANLVKNDVLRISGTAYFNNHEAYVKIAGYDVNFFIAVSVFDCSETDFASGMYPSFTLIPLQNYSFDKDGSLCFSAQVTIPKNYDLHTTRFLVGTGATAVCPDGGTCILPALENTNLISLSYTLDVERPCAAELNNYIIKNCCEPIITELVYVPDGLTVGDFLSDDEGNCWEVVSTSLDVTNFSRNFVNNYVSCDECQSDNGCPANLVIQSCCAPGAEFVTGSLPGLQLGDTFVDNHGLCWNVVGETSAPISEESITVTEIINGACEECQTLHPCPIFYKVSSCCLDVGVIIASTTVLNLGDAFVDQFGKCWTVGEVNVNSLPTDYGIDVVTVYPTPIPGEKNCGPCINDNPCPTEYFLTIRACCDTDRVEVTSIPAQFLNFGEGVIISDIWKLCWEVMSVSTVGTETYQIWNWPDEPSIPVYQDCQDCIGQIYGGKKTCYMLFEVINCVTNITSVAICRLPFDPINFGQYYVDKKSEECYQIIGYGYPAFNDPITELDLGLNWSAGTCELCNIYTSAPKIVELQNCCDNSIIVGYVTGNFSNGVGGYYSLYDELNDVVGCFKLLGLSTSGYTNQFSVYNSFNICQECLDTYDPC